MEKGHDYPTATAIATSLIKMHYVDDAEQNDTNDEDIPATGFVEFPENIVQEYEQGILTSLV